MNDCNLCTVHVHGTRGFKKAFSPVYIYSFVNLSIWQCRIRQIGKASVEQTARKNSQQTVKNAHKSHHTNLLSQQQ